MASVNAQAASRRRYDSSRRKAQGEEVRRQTRERILQALLRTLAQGPDALSMPAVAREAGVSVPTVYRYFQNKAALMSALSEYVGARLALDPPGPLPGSPEELADVVAGVTGLVVQLDETLRNAMASADGRRARREIYRRDIVPMVESALAAVAAELPPTTYARLRNAVGLLSSTYAIQFFESNVDLSPDEIGEQIRWAITTLVAATTEDSSRLL